MRCLGAASFLVFRAACLLVGNLFKNSPKSADKFPDFPELVGNRHKLRNSLGPTSLPSFVNENFIKVYSRFGVEDLLSWYNIHIIMSRQTKSASSQYDQKKNYKKGVSV